MYFHKFRLFIFESLETIITCILVLMTIYVLIAFPVEVSGQSMYPNLDTGDRLLVEKITKYFEGYSRGDIVVLHPPENDFIDYVKRVVAVPGDTIKITDCKIYVNRGDVTYLLNESSYLPKNVCTVGSKGINEGRLYVLKENEYAVMGDNRENSSDSRAFGIINESRIQGKVVARLFPFDKLVIY